MEKNKLSLFNQAMEKLQADVAQLIGKAYLCKEAIALANAERVVQGVKEAVKKDREALLAFYSLIVSLRVDLGNDGTCGYSINQINRVLAEHEKAAAEIVSHMMDAGAVKELERTARKIDREHNTCSNEAMPIDRRPPDAMGIHPVAIRLFRRAAKIQKGEAHAGEE